MQIREPHKLKYSLILISPLPLRIKMLKIEDKNYSNIRLIEHQLRIQVSTC